MRRRLTFEALESGDVPTYLGNQLFPLDNPWNQDVAAAPVAANSAAIINAIVARHGGTAPRVHADFGNPLDGNLYGIPVNVATSSTPKYTIYFPDDGYADESDVVQVPIPATRSSRATARPARPPPVDRGDSHLLVYDRDANVLYELYQAAPPDRDEFPYGGTKPAGAVGGVPDLGLGPEHQPLPDHRGHVGRRGRAADPARPGPPGRGQPDAAGGVGVIDHAIRMTVHADPRQLRLPGLARGEQPHRTPTCRGWASGSG